MAIPRESGGALPRRLSDDQPVEYRSRQFVMTGADVSSKDTSIPAEAPDLPDEPDPRAKDELPKRDRPRTINSSSRTRDDDLALQLLQFALAAVESPELVATPTQRIVLASAALLIDEIRAGISRLLYEDDDSDSAEGEASKKRGRRDRSS
jgi:hypothetical protein